MRRRSPRHAIFSRRSVPWRTLTILNAIEIFERHDGPAGDVSRTIVNNWWHALRDAGAVETTGEDALSGGKVYRMALLKPSAEDRRHMLNTEGV